MQKYHLFSIGTIDVLGLLFAACLCGSAHVARADSDIPASAMICPNDQTIEGMDVSQYQSDSTWNLAKGSGRNFVFIKATQGQAIVNDEFAGEWSAAQATGMLRAAYHYFIPTDDPVTQAEYYLRTVGELSATDLPPMFDWEVTNGVPIQTVVARAHQWLDKVEAETGRVPIIYTGPSFFNQLGNPTGIDANHPEGFKKYPLFVSDTLVECPKVPAPWTNWSFWQYRIGAVPGISGNTDFDRYNGLLDDLGTFIQTTVDPAQNYDQSAH
jgi:lysozyme